MTTSWHSLLRRESRFSLEAYQFVRESLSYGQQVMGLGEGAAEEDESEQWAPERPGRHVTGQDLCHAVREYALHQFGLMAKVVLNSWGIGSTADIGEIVYILIDLGVMRTSEGDCREDFNDVYDFEQAFSPSFRTTVAE